MFLWVSIAHVFRPDLTESIHTEIVHPHGVMITLFFFAKIFHVRKINIMFFHM